MFSINVSDLQANPQRFLDLIRFGEECIINQNGAPVARLCAADVSEESLRLLAEASPIASFVVDAQGQCHFVNIHWQKMTGVSLEQSLGSGWTKTIHPDDLQRVLRTWKTYTHTDKEFSLEFRVVTQTDEIHWIHCCVAAITSQNGKYLAINVDVTNQRRAEAELRESENRYRQIVNSASDIIYKTTPDGHFTFVNPRTTRILKCATEDVIGAHYLQFVHPGWRDQVQNFYERQVKDRLSSTYYEFPLVGRDGTEIWIEQNVILTYVNDQLIELQAVARDITKRKASERRLFTQDSIALILTEASSIQETIPVVLETICTTLEWELGSFWEVSRENQVLTCAQIWHSPELKSNSLENINQTLSFGLGDGLPGRVWALNSPIWVNDTWQDPGFERRETLIQAGLRGAVGAPIYAGNKVLGIMEFFSREMRRPDNDLLRLLTNLGSQIGQFIERKQTEADMRESEARKSAILQSAIDCIITIDHEGNITEFNPAAERTFGYMRDEAIGQPMADLLIPPKLRGAHLHGLKQMVLSGEPSMLGKRVEIVAMRKDGSEFPVELAITPTTHRGQPMFTGYLRDITEAKRAEEELRKTRDAAEAASIAKSQFLAVMSHEIRTPLNAIIGMTDLALETQQESERLEFLQSIQMNSESLLALINDILDFSKIEAGQMDLETIAFDPLEIIENVVAMVALKAAGKGLELVAKVDPQIPSKVLGDPTRLRQILMNLVSNAVKFTERGEVVIEVTQQENAHDDTVQLHLAVRDTGIGIAPENQQQIFEKFYQADFSTTRKYGGTGLGLSISKSIAEMMQGQLWLESEEGHGSIFHVELQFPILEKGRTCARSNEVRNLAILIVDDNEPCRNNLKQLLTQAGALVTAASTVEQALACIEDQSFHLILVDRYLPEMDGVELSQTILEMPNGKNAKIVLLVSALHSNTTEPLLQGVRAHLTKPIRQEQLFFGLANALINEPAETKIVEYTEDAAFFVCDPARVLVVEDNPDNQNLARRILAGAGHTVDIAENGQVAVEMTESTAYDLIFMDVQMPLMDGFEATIEIRKRERQKPLQSVPIVALTAHAIEGYREKCLESGMDDYLTKPIRRQRLLDTVQNLAQRKQVILVADDAASNQALIKSYLRHENYRLLFASTGQQVLRLMDSHAVSLILLDMEMPLMNGYEAAQLLRARPEFARLPIVALTGHDGAEERAKCLASGCSEHLAKPYRKQQLLQMIRTQLEAFQTTSMQAVVDTATTETSADPATPGVEMSADEMIAWVDEDIIDLVPGYLNERRTDVTRIQELITHNDFAAIQRLGHNMKGSGQGYGFDDISHIGKHLEASAKEADRAALEKWNHALESYVSKVIFKPKKIEQ